MGEPDCYACGREAAGTRPPREDVAHDEHWRVAHAFDSTLPGWLVLVPRRHVTSIAELRAEEAAGLGGWLHRLSLALHEETGCVKTYVMQFSEQHGYAHLHFHVVPRHADQPEDRTGARVFGYLGASGEDRLAEPVLDDLARRIGARLPAVSEGPP